MVRKKIIKSTIITLLLCVLGSSTSFAAETAGAKSIINSNKKVVVNELEMYKESDKENNLTVDNENSATRNYLNTVGKLASKSNKELNDMGYSDSRIQELKNAKSVIDNNSNNLNLALESSFVKAAASQLTINSRLEGYFHDTAYDQKSGKFKTLIYVQYYWKWEKAPVVQKTDAVGIGVSKNSNLQIYNVNDGLEYFNDIDNSLFGETDLSKNALANLNSNRNAYFLNLPLVSGRKFKRKTALSGYSYNILVNRNSYVDSFDINYIYAHANTSSTPVINLSDNGASIASQSVSSSTAYQKHDHFKISDYVPEEY